MWPFVKKDKKRKLRRNCDNCHTCGFPFKYIQTKFIDSDRLIPYCEKCDEWRSGCYRSHMIFGADLSARPSDSFEECPSDEELAKLREQWLDKNIWIKK